MLMQGLINASTFNSFNIHKEKILWEKDNDCGSDFLVNLTLIKEAARDNILPVSCYNQMFHGFLRQESNKLPVLHIASNCSSFTSGKNVLRKVSKELVLTKETVSFSTLPLEFLQCHVCNSEGLPSALFFIVKDIISYMKIFDVVTGFESDIFNFEDNVIKPLKWFAYVTDYDSFINLTSRARENLDAYVSGSSYRDYFILLFNDLITPLRNKSVAFEEKFYASWLNQHSSVFVNLVKNDKSSFIDFDETLVLTSFVFNNAFKPGIEIVDANLYSYSSSVLVNEVFKVVESFRLSKNPIDSKLSNEYYFTVSTLLSCLIKPFTFNVSENECEYFTLMPRGVYEYLLVFIGKVMNLNNKELPARVIKAFSVTAGVFTPVMLENFIGLWDYKNDTSFASMWEVAKTI